MKRFKRGDTTRVARAIGERLAIIRYDAVIHLKPGSEDHAELPRH